MSINQPAPAHLAANSAHYFLHFEANLNLMVRKTIWPVLLAIVWISLSEFVRNGLLLKSYWTERYQLPGIAFPSQPNNGAVWGIWSLLFAVWIFILSKKFPLIETTFLSWLIGFILMWVVLWSLGVLPVSLPLGAIPLSILECFLASYIVFQFRKRNIGKGSGKLILT